MFGLIPWRKEAMTLPVEYPLATVEREFRTLYNRLFNAWPAMFEEMEERLWNLEVEEKEKEFVVKMEVPGFELPDFHLDLRGNKLLVKAEHTVEAKEPPEKPEPAKKPPNKEVRRYERMLTLPEGLDVEKVAATYRNGVLTIVLPRKEEALARRIPVHA
jgi:HSP20 family protein